MQNKLTYTIKEGCNQMDFDKVTDMLSKSYWAEGVAKWEVLQCSENSSLVVGAFTAENIQVGFARVVSDKTRFGFIMDVMVDENFRQQGIGQAMIDFILKHPSLKDVYFWSLKTKDAHGVYSKLGFKPISETEYWMENRQPRPKR